MIVPDPVDAEVEGSYSPGVGVGVGVYICGWLRTDAAAVVPGTGIIMLAMH